MRTTSTRWSRGTRPTVCTGWRAEQSTAARTSSARWSSAHCRHIPISGSRFATPSRPTITSRSSTRCAEPKWTRSATGPAPGARSTSTARWSERWIATGASARASTTSTTSPSGVNWDSPTEYRRVQPVVVVVVGAEVDVDVDADDVLVVELELDDVVGVVTDGTVIGGIVICVAQAMLAFT